MDAVGGEQRGPCEEHLLADTRGAEDSADHLRISFFRDGRNCMRHFPEHPTTPPACFIDYESAYPHCVARLLDGSVRHQPERW